MRALSISMLFLCLLLPRLGRADDAALAKQAYERGMAHFQLGEYDDAITKWQDGFRLKPVPEFLYNIGQAYRLSNRPEKALQAYRAYLRMSPDAPNHVQVEKHIVALQALVDQQRRTASAPPTSPQNPSIESSSSAGEPHAPAGEPQPTASPPTATTSPPSTGNQLVAAAPERKQPITKKPWFWGVVAGGAVVVAGAVVLGVVLGTRDNAKVLPDLRY